MELSLRPIGKITAGQSFTITLNPEYAQGLAGLKGFSHLLILWYANKAPTWDASALIMEKPYRCAPERLGVFATRAPYRPNSVCVTVATVASIDEKKGEIRLWWIDAEDGTPVIDIKPYHPCSDRVRDVQVPAWCEHWPKWYEDSGSFAWDKEFLF